MPRRKSISVFVRRWRFSCYPWLRSARCGGGWPRRSRWRARRSIPAPSSSACPTRRSAAPRTPLSTPTFMSRRADRRRISPSSANIHQLRAHLFGRQRPRPGARARRASRAEGHPGHLARQRPAEEPVADPDRGRASPRISRRHHRARGRQRGAVARRNDPIRPRRADPRWSRRR